MKRKKVIFEEMMTENFLILMSDTKPEIQKAHKRAKRINTKNNNNKKKTNKQTKNYTLAYHIQTLENQKKKMHWKKQSKKKKKQVILHGKIKIPHSKWEIWIYKGLYYILKTTYKGKNTFN